MHTFRSSLVLALTLALAACVDTTGLSPESSRTPHAKSNPSAVVVVREYSDLQCPACRGAYEQLNPLLLEKYGKDIRFEFMHFPLQTIHPWALAAAEAAECAADQGKFWEFTDLIYAEQEKLSSSQLRTWAESLSLDLDTYDRCTKSHIKRKEILAESDEGSALGVRGTPTYIVNGVIVEATGEALSKAIEEAKKSMTSRPL